MLGPWCWRYSPSFCQNAAHPTTLQFKKTSTLACCVVQKSFLLNFFCIKGKESHDTRKRWRRGFYHSQQWCVYTPKHELVALHLLYFPLAFLRNVPCHICNHTAFSHLSLLILGENQQEVRAEINLDALDNPIYKTRAESTYDMQQPPLMIKPCGQGRHWRSSLQTSYAHCQHQILTMQKQQDDSLVTHCWECNWIQKYRCQQH